MHRMKQGRRPVAVGVVVAAFCGGGLAGVAHAQVHSVPANPNVPLQNHDIISGLATTLKAAAPDSLVGEDWVWNPGDGSGTCNGSATSGNIDATPTPAQLALLDDVGFNPYWALWCQHTYTGNVGDVFIATVTVDTNGSAGGPYTAQYRMEIRANALPAQVNAGIDEALWFMHRSQTRFSGAVTQNNGSTTIGAIPMGMWNFPQKPSGHLEASGTGAAINAFEANGYLETGPATSPYTDTVARGMRYIIASLGTTAIGLQHFDRPPGTGGGTPLTGDNPDSNGNGIGVFATSPFPPYASGMVMDGIIASGTPNAVAVTGPANVIGRTYAQIIQDMVDYYAWSQGDGISAAGASTGGGGWRYSAADNTTGATDNSTNGWAAIGLIAAEDLFGATVPQWVKDLNIASLELTDNESPVGDNDGIHGYTNSPSPVFGPSGVTAAAMVQMNMDGILSTTAVTPDERWVRAENFFRRHFNDAAIGENFKNYYYAMFNFAKAMRTALPSPVITIGANNSVGCGPNGGVPGCGSALAPLDWYNEPALGLARTVLNYQVTSGVNIGMFNNRVGPAESSAHQEHEQQWATQILTRTLFQAGPIARAQATPNPAAEGTIISFDPSGSFHQDPARSIVQYQWDFDNNGTFDTSTPTASIVTHSFSCAPNPLPCAFPVTLRVTDNNNPALTANDVVVINITSPPFPPTADADGSYLACTTETLRLDGSRSFDLDEGRSLSGNPPFDTIISYEWDLDLASGAPFDVIGATGVNPVVAALPGGTRDIGLRVTDNSMAAFGTANNLTDTDSTTATIGDCGCIGAITVRPKSGENQLVWSPVAGAASYDIQRSTLGPNSGFSQIASGVVTSYATYLNTGLSNGTRYWYRVTPRDAQGAALCPFSAAASGTPNARAR
jgi:hypothetical protein